MTFPAINSVTLTEGGGFKPALFLISTYFILVVGINTVYARYVLLSILYNALT